MQSDLVSIIMPCHNGAAYIADAIRSVQNQTFSDWELLVIDDSSTDDSVRIAAGFAESDSRIRLLKNEKSTGLPATPRNVGIAAASGRYIAFLDCDDEWLPTKLERQLPLFAMRNVAVVFSYYGKMDGSGGMEQNPTLSPMVVDFQQLLLGNCIGNLTGMYDTQKCGKVFQKEIHHEDFLQWLEILGKGFVAMNTRTCEAFYRVQKTSLSGNKLQAMRWHWHILRGELALPLMTAARCFLAYVINAVRKRKYYGALRWGGANRYNIRIYNGFSTDCTWFDCEGWCA